MLRSANAFTVLRGFWKTIRSSITGAFIEQPPSKLNSDTVFFVPVQASISLLKIGIRFSFAPPTARTDPFGSSVQKGQFSR